MLLFAHALVSQDVSGKDHLHFLIPTLMFGQFSAVMYMQVLSSINLSKLCNYTMDK